MFATCLSTKFLFRPIHSIDYVLVWSFEREFTWQRYYPLLKYGQSKIFHSCPIFFVSFGEKKRSRGAITIALFISTIFIQKLRSWIFRSFQDIIEILWTKNSGRIFHFSFKWAPDLGFKDSHASGSLLKGKEQREKRVYSLGISVSPSSDNMPKKRNQAKVQKRINEKGREWAGIKQDVLNKRMVNPRTKWPAVAHTQGPGIMWNRNRECEKKTFRTRKTKKCIYSQIPEQLNDENEIEETETYKNPITLKLEKPTGSFAN